MALSSGQKICYAIILILTILLAGLIFASNYHFIQPQPRAIITIQKITILETGMSLDMPIPSPDYYNKLTTAHKIRSSMEIRSLFQESTSKLQLFQESTSKLWLSQEIINRPLLPQELTPKQLLTKPSHKLLSQETQP